MEGHVLDKLLSDLNGSLGEMEPGAPQFHDDRYEPKPLQDGIFNPLPLPGG